MNLETIKQQFGEYQDNTNYIRNVQNSSKIRDDILKMEKCKRSYQGDRQSQEFRELCISECRFLYDNYMYIFNKLLKDVLNLKIMFTLLQVMQEIETGKKTQEEGSVLVGNILKELYLDCAVREGEKNDELHASENPPPLEGKALSWKRFKERPLGK